MTDKLIHIIGGPTASGKSSKALEIADTCDGVIINADSMQIYDGLPTLTAQPSNQDKTQHTRTSFTARCTLMRHAQQEIGVRWLSH